MQELNKTIATRTSLPWTSTKTKPSTSKSDQPNGRGPSLPWIQRQPTSSSSPESGPANEPTGQFLTPAGSLDPKEAAKERTERRRRIVTGAMNGTGKMDPFDCLPVKAGKSQYALVEYCKFFPAISIHVLAHCTCRGCLLCSLLFLMLLLPPRPGLHLRLRTLPIGPSSPKKY